MITDRYLNESPLKANYKTFIFLKLNQFSIYDYFCYSIKFLAHNYKLTAQYFPFCCEKVHNCLKDSKFCQNHLKSSLWFEIQIKII